MNKKKYIAINLMLFAILYLLVAFNKEFIRPVYGTLPILGILTGSFSNFLAAYILSLFAISPIISHKIEIRKSRYIFYTVAIAVFTILAIEEIKPFVSASKTFDIYDIAGSALGSILAIVTFEFIMKKINYKSE
ncbi:MAG: hypothetical protein L3J54_03825 [Draconibacterium sp.]|nr:hypothetical protein [Draconibacterium sp.]